MSAHSGKNCNRRKFRMKSTAELLAEMERDEEAREESKRRYAAANTVREPKNAVPTPPKSVCPQCKGTGKADGGRGHNGMGPCQCCMGEGKLWCAMCGAYGDHRSGGCPELHPPSDQAQRARGPEVV